MTGRILIAFFLLSLIPAMAASYRFGAVWDGEKVQKDVCINTREERIESIGLAGRTPLTCRGIRRFRV